MKLLQYWQSQRRGVNTKTSSKLSVYLEIDVIARGTLAVRRSQEVSTFNAPVFAFDYFSIIIIEAYEGVPTCCQRIIWVFSFALQISWLLL